MKRIYLIVCFLLFVTLCFAQKQDSTKRDTLISRIVNPPAPNPNKYTPNLTLPSPHAATLGEYGNTPINLSSGLPTPNISFFDLKEGDIGLNVGVSYQYKGFKPFEAPSLLGRGWTLNAGGVITRVIKSKPDEKRPISASGSTYGYATAENRTNLATYINNDGTLASSSPGQSFPYSFPDGEPDIFMFNFMGMTGKFFFGEDGIIHVVSDRKLKIEYKTVTLTQVPADDPTMDKTHFVEFTITDENGTIYKFGDTSASVALPIKNVEFSTSGSDFQCLGGNKNITSWFVAEVTDKNGRKINFNYTNDYINQTDGTLYFDYNLRGRSISSPVARGQYQSSSRTYSYDNIWSCVGSYENFLTSVSGTNWTVNFEYNKTENVTYLTKTTLKSNLIPKQDIKKFTFNFLNLTNPDGLLLSTLTESSPDNSITKQHTFNYHDTTNLFYQLLYAIDYWGFDNGATNNVTLIPDNPYNANRNPDFSTTLKGALTKITYPTAGSTEFVYEQNEYGQVRESDSENGTLINKKPYGGIRVKTIIDKDVDGTLLVQKDYNYNSFANANKSSGVISSSIGLTKIISNGVFVSPESTAPSFPTLANGTIYYSEGLHSIAEIPIYYTNITETLSDGASTKTDFTSHNDYNDFLGVNYGRGNNQMGSPASYLLMRSLPKEIKHYKNNVLVKEKINAYNLIDRHKARSLFTGSATAGNPLSQSTDFLKAYYTYSGWLQKTSETERLYSDATNFIETVSTNIYNNSTYLQVSSMTTQSSKGETLSMNYKYPYDFSVEPYLTMINKNIIAPVIEETSYLNTTQTTWKSTDYATFGTLQLPEKIRTKIGSGTEITQIVFDTYDSRGNLTKYTSRSGQSSIMQYFGTSDLGKTDLLFRQTIGGGSLGTELSRRTEYEYIPLIGLQFMDDINGYRNSFQYDVFNRLKSVKDHLNYLLKDNYYHYANETALTGLEITPTNSMNYVVNRTARIEQTGTSLDSDVDSTTTQLSYVDGIGRGLQSLVWKGTPDKTKDIITGTTQYDGNSRAFKSILITPSDVLTGAYKSTAQTLASAFYDSDTYPYTETVFENSPLNRPIKQFGAGQAWRVAGSEKFTEINYLIAGTEVIQFNVQADGTIDGSTTYPASSLYNNRVVSERGFWTIELKDKQGRVTHKFQQLQAGFTFAITAYVYNDLGQLAYVISPKAYQKFGTDTGQILSFTESDDIFKELCFGYHYDNLGRLSEKKIPGASWKYSVFDKHDREIAFADESDRAKGFWHFRKFDALGREIYGGILNGKGLTNRATLQTAFDSFTGQAYETFGSDLYNYTNVSFPTAYAPVNADVMNVNYYDNYFGWKPSNDCEFQETNAFHLQGFSKGLLTGTLSRNIETNDWLRAVNYYDYRGKLIQTFFTNHKGNIERSDFQYRFNGEVLKMRLVHEGITEIYEYDYDHIGRKTSFKHNKDGVRKTIAGYEYDEIGRLKLKAFCPINETGSKKTGEWVNPDTWENNSIPTINDNVIIVGAHTITIPLSTIANANNLRIQNGILENFGTLNLGNFNALLSKLPKNNNVSTLVSALEIVNYNYHIRGGLRGINLDASNNLTDKIFSFKLGYEDANFFDGNIGKQEWKSNIDGQKRSFTYIYDGASRIKSGTYESDKVGENYSLNNVTYDFNGNITNLSRNGWKSNNTFGLIDNLNYTYQSNSNKIQAVTDASNETASFTDATGTTDYTYSLDGSLISDANKGITVIEYNYLKKPRRVVRNGVEILYQYAANGTKLRETTGTDFTDYLGNIIKKNDVIYQISHDEGRIIDGEYEYNIKDHLGNLRVAFRDSLGIAKISQYYAYGVWGEDLPTLSYLKQAWKVDNFKFTGKENLSGTGFIDFGARWYDNIVPRFTTIDPLSELSRRFSPTVYGNDNPVLMIDPDGMRTTNSIQKMWDDTAEGSSSTWTNDGDGGFSDGGGDKGKQTEEQRLSEIVTIKGQQYHKNTSNLFASIGNKINSLFGGSSDYFVEKKPYDPVDAKAMNELVVNSAGGVVGMGIGKLLFGRFLGGVAPIVTSESGYVVENIAGYYVRGNTSIAKGTYTRTIQALANYEGKSLFNLMKTFEAQAREAGVKNIIINGVGIVETRLINQEGAKLLGYGFQQTSSNSIQLTKILK